MKELTTVARFALFALQRTNQPMRFGTLASMIDEWGEPLQKALDTLIRVPPGTLSWPQYSPSFTPGGY